MGRTPERPTPPEHSGLVLKSLSYRTRGDTVRTLENTEKPMKQTGLCLDVPVKYLANFPYTQTARTTLFFATRGLLSGFPGLPYSNPGLGFQVSRWGDYCTPDGCSKSEGAEPYCG